MYSAIQEFRGVHLMGLGMKQRGKRRKCLEHETSAQFLCISAMTRSAFQLVSLPMYSYDVGHSSGHFIPLRTISFVGPIGLFTRLTYLTL